MKIHNVSLNTVAKQTDKNKQVAFSGIFNGTHNYIKDFFQLERAGNMSRSLFIFNAFVFLLGGRLLNCRDKNETRETLTRDVPSITLAVFGVPAIGNAVAKSLQDAKGFAITDEKDPGWIAKIFGKDHSYETAGYDKLKTWYVYDDNLTLGFDGFSERLSKQGGNLKEIYSSLSKEIKHRLAEFSDDNTEFLKKLNESDNKNLINELKTLLKDGNNKALEKAAFLKTFTKLFGFILTLLSIGLFLPKFNIFLTEKINKNKKVLESEQEQKPAEVKPIETINKWEAYKSNQKTM
ncbi:MAG: hypothetical protein PHC64_00830 [Candidatus Gastranaerophilales bacterium]|nr:hypothetical protein [Candidatus Gastranaerophilales bacterium]